MNQTNFRFYKPCKPLQPYVRYYWAFESDRPLSVLTFPIGCPQLIFHKKKTLYVPELGTWQASLAVSGQVNYPSHLCSEGNVEMLVAVFKPYGMKAFFNQPMSLLYNQEISVYDFGNKELLELGIRILECGDTGRCVCMLEQWLLSQMAGMQTAQAALDMRRMIAAMQCLLASPETAVTELAAVSCLGKKQFERLFRRVVGTNPKEYARIARFQKSLSLMQHHTDDGNLARLACRCGYADQSHFIRDFRTYSGHTPLSLPDGCKPYSDLYTEPV